MSCPDPTMPSMDRRMSIGLALAAFATLLIEVDLIRLFSFLAWYHFAYLILSVAMLGFGAAGAVLARWPALLSGDVRGRLGRLSFAAAVAVMVSYAIITRVPFRPQALPDVVQALWLTTYYLAVFVPFFLSGLIVATVLSAGAAYIGRLYFWDLLGAGVGSLATLVLMRPLGVPGTIMSGAICLAVAGICFAAQLSIARATLALGGVIVLAIVTLVLFPVRASPAKALSLLVSNPATRMLSTEWHPVARVDTLEFPLQEELRLNPKSMTQLWYGTLPADRRILYDGDASPAIIRFDGDISRLGQIDGLLQSTPYKLVHEPSVLIIGLGGGFDVLVGLRNGARRIVGVDVHPLAIDIVKNRYADYAGHIYQDPKVEVHAAEGRNFIGRTDERFDLIQMTTVDSLVARSMGAYILSESYLFTVEAIQQLLDRLAPGGVFSIVDGDPPPGVTHAHALREAGIILAALEERGVKDAARHMMVVSRYESPVALVNTLVRLTPFTDEEIGRVRDFSESRGFAVYHPPRVRDVPVDDIGTLISLSPLERERFYDADKLQLRPTRDDSPFFFNFHKWRNILHWSRFTMSRDAPTGQLVLATMLAQSVFFSILFILAPLPRLKLDRAPRGTALACLAYFSALGIGFMFLEISFIQRFVLFLGNPAYAVSVVLGGLLIAAGAGSLMIHGSGGSEEVLLRRATLLLMTLGLTYTFGLPALFSQLRALGEIQRFLVGLLLVIPLGLVLGQFLPIGIRIVNRIEPALVPWAWGINTCTSVVSAVLAVILAMSAGFRTVCLVALGLYLGGAVLMWRVERRSASFRRPTV